MLSRALHAVGSLIIPKTTRGKVRQLAVLVFLLLAGVGTYAAPQYWNAAAQGVNGLVKRDVIPTIADANYTLGLDLKGGTHLVYTADVAKLAPSEQEEALSGVRDVIERRVNAYGVSEPLVQTNRSGDIWRIIVDLAGVSDVNEAIKLIGETPILEFKEPNTELPREMTAEEKAKLEAYNANIDKLAGEVLAKAKEPNADFAALAKEYSQDEATKANGGDTGFVKEGNTLQLDASGAGTPVPGPYNAIIRAYDSKPVENGQLLPGLVTDTYGTHVTKFEEKRETGKEIEASHILVCYNGAPNCTKERTKDEALALINQIKGETIVANFAEKAKQYSDDSSAAEGGSLGFFGTGDMVKPFEDAAFALTQNTISEVVETEFGYHIILRTNERSVYEYRFSDILLKKQTAADYVGQPEPWKNTELSGKHLADAALQFDPNTNAPMVSLRFNDEGKQLFADITTRNINKQVAIFLDGEILSAPVVQQAITEGEAVISSGDFTIPAAKQLAQRLRAGALPVPITLETQQTIGASLGQDAFTKTVYAGIVGFLIVVAFMIAYYRLPGVIAAVALLLYVAINLALYRLIPVTLTLSGIAGFILSLGMAVDANVLIFERLKEELAKGRPIDSAIDEGFKRAWSSIRDSNFATLISCAILFYTSSSLIRGFAFTLALGVLVSMFSAIFASRTLLRLVLAWKPLQKTWLVKSR